MDFLHTGDNYVDALFPWGISVHLPCADLYYHRNFQQGGFFHHIGDFVCANQYSDGAIYRRVQEIKFSMLFQ